MELTQQVWIAADVGRMLELLDRHRPQPAAKEDLRGFDWHYLWGLCHRERLTVDRFKLRLGSLAYSPDGEWVAVAEGHMQMPFLGSKDASVGNAETWQKVATLSGHTAPACSLAFSPAEELLATSSWDGTAKLWDVASGRLRATLPGLTWGVVGSCLALSPDGRTLAVTGGVESRSGRLMLWDVASALSGASSVSPRADLRGHTGLIQCVAFHPDGRTLVTGSQDCTAILWDAATGRQRATLQHARGVLCAAFSPDGTFLATGSFDHTISVWNVPMPNLCARVRAHQGPVLAIAFSPDGQLLASGSQDTSVKLWDFTGSIRHLLSLQGHRAFVSSLAFSPDGKTLITGGHSLKLWDVRPEQGRPLSHGAQPIAIRCLACSADGRLVAADGLDGRVKLWELDTRELRRVFKADPGNVTAVAFSADGALLASGGADGVKIWDPATGRPRDAMFRGVGVYGLAFSPDDRLLAVGTGDPDRPAGKVILWDVKAGRPLDTLRGQDEGVTCLAFAPDGKSLVSGGWTGKLKLWDVAARTERGTFQGHDSVVLCAAFSPDGKTLASAGGDRTVKVWNVATQQVIATLQGHRYRINCLAFSPDGKTLVTGAGETTAWRSELKRWRLTDGTEGGASFAERPWGDPIRLMGGVGGVAFSPDGKLLITGSYDKSLQLWDATSGKLSTTLQTKEVDRVHFVGLSPEGKTLVSVSRKRVKVWDVASRRERATLHAADLVGPDSEGQPLNIVCAALSPDGKTLAVGGGLTFDSVPSPHVEKGAFFNPVTLLRRVTKAKAMVRLIDLPSGKVVATLADLPRPILAMAFSPDGQLLAGGGRDKLLRLWDLKERAEAATLQAPSGGLEALRFSPDGELLALGGRDGSVRLWHVDSKAQVASLEGHRHAVSSLAFSGDGKTLASGSWDGTVRLWDVRDRRLRTTLQARQREVLAVALSPDGKTLVTSTGDFLKPTEPGEVRLWDPITGQEGILLSRSKGLVLAVAFSDDGKTLVTAGGPGYFTSEGPGFVHVWQAAGHHEQVLERLPSASFASDARFEYIDLRCKTNRRLEEGTPPELGDNNLQELPQGEQHCAGVTFKIGDALIQLAGKALPERPERVTGIPVNRKFTRLHILHGTQFGAARYIVEDGTPIGQYRMHYEDQAVQTIPIVYGEDVRDWWNHDRWKPMTRGKLAWAGGNPAARKENKALRLYVATWEDPWPDKKIISIDYASVSSQAAPFCLAMSIEEAAGPTTDP